MRHDEGTSATSVVPTGRRLDLEPPAGERHALAHPGEPEASSSVELGSKPRPSSSTTATTAPSFRCRRMLTRLRAGVLDDVRQRLLDDAVERRLGLGRQPLVAELRSRSTVEAALLAERFASRSTAGTSPKSSSADGRSSTASRRTFWSVETTSSRTDATASRASSAPPPARAASARAGSRSAPGRSRRAARARAGALELLRLDDTTDGVAADPLGQIDGDRRPRRERLRQAQVVLAEGRRGARLSCAITTPIARPRRSAERRAPNARRAGASPAGRLRIVEHGVDALAAPALEHAARLRAAERELHPGDAVGALALGRGDTQRSPSGGRSGRASPRQLLQPARDEREQRLQLELRDERVADLLQRLDWRSQRVELS